MKKNNVYQYHSMKVFPKSAINGLTKKLSSFRFNDNNTNHDNAYDKTLMWAREQGLNWSHNDYEIDGDIFLFEKARKITKEQTQFGKTWLKNHFYTPKGMIRQTKGICKSIRVRSIVLGITRFEFVGVIGLRNSFGDYVQFVPIYRTYKGGAYFDYAPIHWGQPIIMEGL